MIIALSGIDGSGKSTCAEMIQKIMLEKGEKCIIVDAMQNGIFIEMLKKKSKAQNIGMRQICSADLLNTLWAIDLINNYEKCINEYINNGYSVIMHRSELCCRVYSKLFDIDNEKVDELLDLFNLKYDIHIHLDIRPEVAYQRILNRKHVTQTEKERVDMLVAADNIYNTYLSASKYRNVVRFNPDISLDSVFQKLQSILINQT